MKAIRSYHKDLMQDLQDPREAISYLNAALEDGDKEAFLLAFRNVVEAQGGMSRASRVTRIHRVSLYKMLSKKGNPGIDSLMELLRLIGARMQLTGPVRLRQAA
ncbi:MAG: transcriptional regulator [Elusimicrobia bacterium]|nr:transcriptional regulator [Elusimicrobiota bacterium]